MAHTLSPAISLIKVETIIIPIIGAFAAVDETPSTLQPAGY
jgi:hypothetical protein